MKYSTIFTLAILLATANAFQLFKSNPLMAEQSAPTTVDITSPNMSCFSMVSEYYKGFSFWGDMSTGAPYVGNIQNFSSATSQGKGQTSTAKIVWNMCTSVPASADLGLGCDFNDKTYPYGYIVVSTTTTPTSGTPSTSNFCYPVFQSLLGNNIKFTVAATEN
jgi:hypothetical protein